MFEIIITLDKLGNPIRFVSCSSPDTQKLKAQTSEDNDKSIPRNLPSNLL